MTPLKAPVAYSVVTAWGVLGTGWLVGWLVGWLGGWLVGWLAGEQTQNGVFTGKSKETDKYL
jgi:hypothetical protein